MKILIGTPNYNKSINDDMADDLIRVCVNLVQKGWAVDWHHPSSPFVAFSRNLIARKALKEEFDWLLFWDADIQISTPQIVEKLIETAHKYNSLVVAVPVKIKMPDREIYNLAFKKDKAYENVVECKKEPFEIDVAGAALMLIKPQLFLKLERPYFN